MVRLRLGAEGRLQQRAQRLAGAVQARLDGARCQAKQASRLLGVHPFDVAQQQDGAVVVGQLGDVAADGLARFVALQRRGRVGPVARAGAAPGSAIHGPNAM